jgi:hypothetical protein
MKDIYLYSTIDSWISEAPDATVRGIVNNKTTHFIEIVDENGYTQIINLDRVFAIVF